MLCPNCGKDVGEKPKLCDDCEKASKGPEPEESPATDEAPAPENLPSVNLKAQKKAAKQPPQRMTGDGKKNVPVIIAFAVILIGGVGAFLFFQGGSSGGSTGPAAGSSSGASTSSGGPSGAATPGAQPASTLAPQPAATAGAVGGTGGVKPAASAAPTTSHQGPAKEISITNALWRDSVALFDKQKTEMTIGLYTEVLPNDEKAKAVAAEKLPPRTPRFVLTIALESGAKEFQGSNAKSIRASYVGPEVEESGVSVSYVIGKKDSPLASGLGGRIEAGELIELVTKQSTEKTLENGKHIKLSWDLTVKAPILAVVGRAEAASPTPTAASPAGAPTQSPPAGTEISESPEETPAPKESGPPELSEGDLGSISAESQSMSIKDAYGLYYPETGAVAIGLYGQTLDDSERAELQKKKIVTVAVNGKRPSFVFSIDFSKKNGDISKQTLVGYSAYFYRDTSGLFYFPGNYDSKSVKRAASDLQPYEFTVLKGQLKDGGELMIRTAGDNNPQEGQTKLGWNLALKVLLHEVK